MADLAARGRTNSHRPRWLSVAAAVAAVALATGMFTLSRDVTDRDNQRLATFQAQNAKTTFTALISQIESTIASVGSVAAATDGAPTAIDHLTAADPATGIFSGLAILHRSGTGVISTVAERGTVSAPLPGLLGSKAILLANIERHGGTDILGFYGHGKSRHLAMASGAPTVPGAYVVYVEIPLPAGTTLASGFPGLQYAVYDGRTSHSPLLFSTTRAVPLTGQRVDQLVDMDDLYATGSPKPGDDLLLFVVSSSGATAGSLSHLLPWVLGGLTILAGSLVVFVVEATSRRKDQALGLVVDLEEKNAELDRALAEREKAEEIRVRLESELRQSQRLEAVGRLAGGVAHDFNNLLAVIMTYGDFIADELGPDHPLQEDLEEVRKATRRATDLTRQLLVFSRRDLIEPSVIDVNDTIMDLLNLLRRTLGEQITLDAVLAPDLPRVLADPGELEQVLVNLAVNARDAIGSEGTITVETTAQAIDEDAAAAHADVRAGSYVRIAVTDTGCGMAPDVVERVFEPFFTTKEPGRGTGLGLATVYAITNRYGGFITIYSEVGVGTTFKVHLPVTDEEVLPVAAEVPVASIPVAGGTVLLVEDEESVRKACSRILEKAGYRVLIADSGSQALAELSDEPVDLLLTDVIMPGGVSGRDLAERLQEDQPDLRVLFMSGYNADAIATRGILDPGVTVVEKPFTSSDLLGKVRELLH